MSEDILNDLQIDARLAKAGGKCVSEVMAAKVRQEDGIGLNANLFKYFIVAVTNCSLDCLIQISLVLNMTVTVYENKIIVAVNLIHTCQIRILLIFTLHFKRRPNLRSHRYQTLSSFRLWSVDRIVASKVITVVIVNEGVIDTDHAFFKIHITPTKSGNLANTHTCIYHNIKDRIPVKIFRICFQEANKEFLLISCKGVSLFPLVVMRGFQLLEHIINGVIPDVVIIDRHLKNLMKHIVNILNGSYLHHLTVCQAVIEFADIGLLDLSNPVLSKGRHNECFVHINVVFHRRVLNTSLELAP